MRTVDAFLLPGLFYPLLLSTDLGRFSPHPARINGTRLVVFREKATRQAVAHSDLCPHQGASLSKGWINVRGHLQCPYHGFAFDQGCFVGAKGRKRGKCFLPPWPTREEDGMVMVRSPGPTSSSVTHEELRLPEVRDPAFRRVRGVQRVRQDQRVVTENVLDNLHVAYVHTFGSPLTPLPRNLTFEWLGNFSGRTTFSFSPRRGTLATLLQPQGAEVVVENEFYLPSTTVTRVCTGPFVKTVVTRSLPESPASTLLFYDVYRNFWCDPLGIGDALLGALMRRTVHEDMDILRHVDASHREGPLRTAFDVTIRKYREACRRWIEDAST